MFARKLSSDGRIRWPAPCRARNATRWPRSVARMYAPEGSPNGVSIFFSSRSVSCAMSYRPLPPMIPMVAVGIFLCVRVGTVLFQLDENPAGAGGMNECDQRSFGAGARLLVYEPYAARLQSRERLRDVVDAQRDVVQPRPALLDVLRDGRIRRRPFEQLQLRAADRDEVGAHALRRDLLGRFDLQPERVAIEGERGGQVFHGNADVIENGFHIPVAVQDFYVGFAFLCVSWRLTASPSAISPSPRNTDRARAPQSARPSTRARRAQVCHARGDP